MVDVVISIAAKVAELMVVSVGKHICYPFKYNSNMDELKKQVEKLKGERDKLQHSIYEAMRQGDEIEQVVEKWLTKVDEFTRGVDDQDRAGKLCSIGFCPNLMARYSLSKKAAKTTKDGLDLLGEGRFDKVSYRPLLRKTASTYIRGYEDFDSRTPIFQEIMQALKDDKFKMIGVYGMGGVGKTTLVKRVVAQAIEDKLFDFETAIDISETPDIKKIQQQIADDLGLNFHEESLSTRAVRLRDRLKKEKKVLIVLDNIRAKLDLEAVGIPFGHEEEKESSSLQEEDRKGRNDDQRRCKILLTSRSEVVLSNDMNAEKNFLVEILSEEEAGNLFWKIIGESAKNCDFEAVGVEIIKYCAGLPVGIVTIASALKKKSLFDWKDALDQLRRSNPRHIEGMDANVYSAIKLSYDFLESEEAKSLFLLCSLGNASTEFSFAYLLRFCMGLGLFQNVSTLEQGRNRLHTLINHLKVSCLLLDGNTNGFFKMVDIIHAVAVSIASTDKLMFNIQDVTDLKETLEEKLPKDSTAISLFHKDVSMLPERLAYPKLKLFFLFMQEFSLQIPDTFFEGMEELKVLNMTKIHMLSLPSSLSKLTYLQTLCLENCQLRNVAIIGELKRLEILCFLGSDIEQLPAQIGQLTRLRLLELSDCSNLKVISPNVLSSLTRLEELYLGNSFIEWEVEGKSNASLSEVKQLSRLTTLEIHVLDARIMPQDFLIFEKLERYGIFIGDVQEWSHDYEALRTLKLKLKLDNSIYLRNGIKSLLSKTQDLYLDVPKGVKNVFYQLNGEGFPQLKHLHVQNGPQIQYIVNSIGWGLCNVFPKLESLFLHNLINLEKICHGQLATESFNRLKIMKIGRCDGLKHLFSFSIAKNLLQLQEIEVTNCNKLEEIVFKESHEQFQQNDSVSKNLTQFGSGNSVEFLSLTQFSASASAYQDDIEVICHTLFPNLNRLDLIDLPELTSFCNFVGNAIELPSLARLWIVNCPNMRTFISNSKCADMSTSKDNLHTDIHPLFDEKVGFPSLEKMVISGMDNLESIWYNQFLGDSFYKLKSVEVNDCQELRTIFPNCICGRLLSLESLTVKSCGLVEEIFDLQGLNLKEKHSTEITTQLRELYVDHMSNLKHIWNEDPKGMLSYQKLQKVTVFLCPNLENLFRASVAKSLLNLVSLDVSDCGLLEEIIAKGGVKEAADRLLFPKLSSLQLHNLPQLRTFYTGQTVEVSCLKRLGLHHCDKVKLFISEFLGFNETIELEELQLSGKAITMEWPDQVPGHVFRLLKSLELNDHESTVLPLDFIQRFGRPEKLSLNSSSYKEIFSHGEVNERSQIKHLVLSGLFDLKQIWKEDSKIDLNFQKLEILEVRSCFNLNNLIPSSASFKNLMILEVWGCEGLKNLLTSSTAKSLVLLEKLEVFDCKMLIEVVANEGAVTEEINFRKLKSLSLVYLQSLASFCSMKHILNFPILESLVVNECPKMKIFSEGVTSTPKLHELELNWEAFEQSPEVGVNTTIKQSMEKRFCSHGEGKLRGIINTEELRGEGKLIKMVFAKLIKLQHKGLLNLTQFGSGNSVEFSSSTQKTFSSAITSADVKQSNEIEQMNCQYDIHPLFGEAVVLPTLAFMNLSSIRIQTIWHNQLQPMPSIFQNLTEIAVGGCDTLEYVYSASMVECLIQLTHLEISNCKFVEAVIITQGERTSNSLFPKLCWLHLEDLPKLTSFCNFEGKSIELPSLDLLWLENCPKMQAFVSNSPDADIPTNKEEQVNSEQSLHANIQPLFDEKNGQSSEEN